ncbi:MAG TPA: hypothetical protein VIE65_08555 [Methylobacter sp.]|jgi:hypothetical protein
MASSTYLHVTHQFNLNQVCRPLVDAFGWHIFQVGSSLVRRDWHDIDIRCILDDDEFERMFPGESIDPATGRRPRLDLLNTVMSEWLQSRTGLPIDFQFQWQTEANEKYKGPRSALGVILPKTRG